MRQWFHDPKGEWNGMVLFLAARRASPSDGAVKAKRGWGCRALLALMVFLAIAGVVAVAWDRREISGLVQDPFGRPIVGATIRIRASQQATLSDSEGRFVLTTSNRAIKTRLTAWADGYYIAGHSLWPWDRRVTLTLSPYTVDDNPGYAWIPPAIEGRSTWDNIKIRALLDASALFAPDTFFFKIADGLSLGCRDCHGEVIYEQWVGEGHSLGFNNPRFASMYLGRDLNGRQSPPTRFGVNQDYGRFPLPPDMSQPYFGPGYKLDFPETDGNCAACHLPAAALAAPYETDPTMVSGTNAHGSHCDFCHKISAVRLDEATGLPYENMPGILTLEMMRPSLERQLFIGPYDDVDAGTDTYQSLQRQSQLCAACHTASFWGVPIYQSFAEWVASPYSDPEEGQTCQDCHMRPDGQTTNFAPGRAGQERNPETIASHTFPGAGDADLLQNAVSMYAYARSDGNQIIVEVEIRNDLTGHDVPTDSPLRQLILLVEARDGLGRPLEQLAGSEVPEWGGSGDPDLGYFGGLPGKAYAKVLAEMWTDVSPTGAYWNPTRLVSDNRLAPFASDHSSYVFSGPEDGEATVGIRLLFRRAYKSLMDQKGWDVPDILMEQQTLLVR